MTVSTNWHLDRNENKVVVERCQDIETILDRNKYLQNEAQTWAGDWHHIGTIPNVIIEKWMNEEGVNILKMPADEWGQFIKRKLRDPENMWLRTTNRRI
tara:strand:- start:5240 stop:5536 length:297 start_codon:yes stop_codon:yes gene_type:complete